MMEKGQVWEHDILCSGNDESEFLFIYFIIFLLSLGKKSWFTCMAEAFQEHRSFGDEGSALKAAIS